MNAATVAGSALLGVLVTVPALAQQHCALVQSTPRIESALRDSTVAWERRSSRSPGDTVFDAGITERVTVPTSAGCVTAYAYSEGFPRPFMGGVFLVDSSGNVVASFPYFASPRYLVPAGSNRVAFEYVESEGAGVLFTHLMVLCSFGTSRWAECLTMPLEEHLSVQEGLEVDRHADFHVRDPYVIVVKHGTWALRHKGEVVRGGDISPDSVQLRLP